MSSPPNNHSHGHTNVASAAENDKNDSSQSTNNEAFANKVVELVNTVKSLKTMYISKHAKSKKPVIQKQVAKRREDLGKLDEERDKVLNDTSRTDREKYAKLHNEAKSSEGTDLEGKKEEMDKLFAEIVRKVSGVNVLKRGLNVLDA